MEALCVNYNFQLTAYSKSLTRIAALVFFIFVVLIARTGAALAQAEDDLRTERTSGASQLSVSPSALTYKVNLEKQTVKVNSFTLINEGSQPLQVTINAPSDPHYVITFPSQLFPSGGSLTVPGKAKHSRANKAEVGVAFAPTAAGEAPNATVLIAADSATSADSATISLRGRASGAAQGLWVGGYKYFSEFQGEALEHSGDPRANLAFASTAFEGPLAMTFDSTNDLWISFSVANSASIPLVEISRSDLVFLKEGLSVKAKALITPEGPLGSSIVFAVSLGFDIAGNLWVGDQEDKAVLEYPASEIGKTGSPVPVVSLTSQDWIPEVIRFDHFDNMWVSEFPPSSPPGTPLQLWEFAPSDRAANGSANPGLIINLPDSLDPVDLAFDSSGDLWIAGSSLSGDKIEMFSAAELQAEGEISPSAAITVTSPAFAGLEGSGSCLGGLDFDHSGDLWVSVGTDNADCTAQTQVVEFTPNQLTSGGNLNPFVSIEQNPAKTNLFLNGPLRLGPIL